MEPLRRIAAGLMLICLALPQRSCEKGGQEVVLYPLSEVTDTLEIIAVVMLYVLPAVLLFIPVARKTVLTVGILVTLAGLYRESYMGWVWSLHVLIGWWIYTAAAVGYVTASAILLWHALRVRLDAARTPV